LLEQGVQRVGADSVQGIELGAGHLHAASLPANGPPEQLPNLSGFQEWTKRGIPLPGDILFTREAPAGEACIVPIEINLCLGQRMVLFQVDRQRVDPRFLLRTLYGGIAKQFIDELSQGTTVVHFNMSDMQTFLYSSHHSMNNNKSSAISIAGQPRSTPSSPRRSKPSP